MNSSISNQSLDDPNRDRLCGWPKQEYEDYAKMRYFEEGLYPVLLALCSFGNFFNIAILRREGYKSSKNLYLTAMSVSDLLYM